MCFSWETCIWGGGAATDAPPAEKWHQQHHLPVVTQGWEHTSAARECRAVLLLALQVWLDSTFLPAWEVLRNDGSCLPTTSEGPQVPEPLMQLVLSLSVRDNTERSLVV